MMHNPFFGSSSPPELAEEIPETIFLGLPPLFILPTHLALEKLHDIENRFIDHGGKLTYDISEAKVILGNIAQKKRAVLELRSRGIWTEEIPMIPALESVDSQGSNERPLKRRKTEAVQSTIDEEIEVVGLKNQSPQEEGIKENRSEPATSFFQDSEDSNVITLLKLEWLDNSIAAGKPLSHASFVVYSGQKIPPPVSASLARSPSHEIPKQILQRAMGDAASQPMPVSPSQFRPHRSREHRAGSSSQRLPPPTLYRQTTSENDDEVPPPPEPDWVRDQILYACMRSAPLHPPNEKFIAQLLKIRRIRELTLDEIGVRAYSTSIASLAAYPHVIRRPTEILALPGCDMKIANLFAEFQQHGGSNDDDGKVSAADALDSDPALRVLNHFNDIWGVGAKTAREFYYHRGWKDLDDIVEHGWNTLSRVQQIGVKFFDEFQDGVSRKESESIAAIVRHHANQVRPETGEEIECILVGGYRRGKEISGDVDLILTHHDDEITRNLIVDVVASLETDLYITHTLSLHLTSTLREQQTLPFRGDETGKHFDTLDKALVVWQDPKFDHGESNAGQDPNKNKKIQILIDELTL
ncbi:hypothetical protein N7462_010109 [Penicillium macrosclerotiorum]|uniref:uncharacterized protein n=1 Tax=Penicillium macrosclerotiorum TaxID=303699 RepID=UPI0025468E90|nr:uncharacterized protein N7462_010109 [Penicillium macrosclerotiorum]KAJ5669039.1 hypothetical protein N7462_010109 [Penicillium macrosclerotiorum]